MELTANQALALAAINADPNVHSAKVTHIGSGYVEVLVNKLGIVTIYDSEDGTSVGTDWDAYHDAEVDAMERREYASNCAMDW